MIGRLTFDKSNQDVGLLLYSVLIVEKYGKDGMIRRKDSEGCFVQRMAELGGKYNKTGEETRTHYNKSLFAQYFGFIDRKEDENKNEYLCLTNRGRRLLPLIEVKSGSKGPTCSIKDENRRLFQDLLWESILFDPHGRDNPGAQDSKTDIDPFGVIFLTIDKLGSATSEEVLYVLFGLNRGDKGLVSINKTFDDLIKDVNENRSRSVYDYSSAFENLGVSKNKITDSKIIKILADDNVRILERSSVDKKLVFYSISDSFRATHPCFGLLSVATRPKQVLLYSDSIDSSISWLRDTLMGRFGDVERYYYLSDLRSSPDNAQRIVLDAVGLLNSKSRSGKQRSLTEYYCCFITETESQLKESFSSLLPLFRRVDDVYSKEYGFSLDPKEIGDVKSLRLPKNLHIVAIINSKSSIMPDPVFDGTFKRFSIENINHVSPIKPNEAFDKEFYNECLGLLQDNHNLILSGAPGTGKTFLARSLAASMIGDCAWSKLSSGQKKLCGFVQFHPSYDYSDFVEGLRPDGEGSFERKDGIFKSFCKNALRISNDPTEALKLFKLDLKEKTTLSIPYYDSTGSFEVILGEHENIIVTPKSGGSQQSATDENISDYIKSNGRIDNNSYSFYISKYIREHYLRDRYVFIIDEINRGELSKIFGELFYSIEPHYRGEDGRILTQYNEMIKDDKDEFKSGFFIPSSVYIIGTMNDIDRSVESMDFAIRRRFAWREVTWEESAKNMQIEGLAREKMNALNSKIFSKLHSTAFCIGGALFREAHNLAELNAVWETKIKGIVAEYFRGEPGAADSILEIENAYKAVVDVPDPEHQTKAPHEDSSSVVS